MSDEQNQNQPDESASEETLEKVEDIELQEGQSEPEAAAQAANSDSAEEVAALKDQLLRMQAEMQNVRRRAEQDVEKAHKFALEKFAGDLLAVADNLERALDSADQADEKQKAVAEGVDLTLKSLLDVLSKYQVQQINPAGEPFDPQLHEALTMVPNPAMEPNTVMDVMQKGYTLHGRLIRAARVVVSKEA